MVSNEKAEYILRSPVDVDLDWIIERQAALYASEYGFDDSFKVLVAQIVADFTAHFDAARERCWIAEINGVRLGHILLVKHPDKPHTAKLRLLLVEPSARGKGVGHALVDECLRFAKSAGYQFVELWTQSSLTAARKIYQQAGFRLVSEEPHLSFGQHLTGQTWRIELQ